jgi:hypothetical protein
MTGILPVYVPIEVMPSLSIGSSGGGGKAIAFFFGEDGADSYTCTSPGVISANRNLRFDERGGVVEPSISTEIGLRIGAAEKYVHQHVVTQNERHGRTGWGGRPGCL